MFDRVINAPMEAVILIKNPRILGFREVLATQIIFKVIRSNWVIKPSVV